MIGGTSWFSTAMYYEQINKGVAKRLGGVNSAPLLIESLNLAPVAALELAGEWDKVAEIVTASARRLEGAGAEGLVLCSNTLHKVAEQAKAEISIPLLHIGDVTAEKLAADGVKRAGLLGTRFTISDPFIRERLETRGIAVQVPAPAT